MNTDLMWLKNAMQIDPSYDQVCIFSERVGIILDGDNNPSKQRIEEARQQAYKQIEKKVFGLLINKAKE